MLAQIEKGDVNPTISVLWKIASGYKVSFTSLVETTKEQVSILRETDVSPLSADEGRYLNYPVFPFDKERLFETCRIVIQPQGSLAAQPHLKGTEEYITVFSGAVEITVDGHTYLLERGAPLRFHADLPHRYRNAGQGPAELSMLIYYN